MTPGKKNYATMRCRPSHQSDASTKGYIKVNYMHQWMQRPELPLLAKKNKEYNALCHHLIQLMWDGFSR
jgi:hypothetical protein